MGSLQITIAERLRPFCHRPGTCCLLPGSPYRLTIYPTLICLHDLSSSIPGPVAELSLPITGPLKDFTVEQDLEKGVVRVWGKSPVGFMRYRLFATAFGGAMVCWEKGLQGLSGIEYLAGGSGAAYSPPETERLSLGRHKGQDWELVRRRGDLQEIFPFWFKLGQLVESPRQASGGTASLLKCCELGSLEAFSKLFAAGFNGILSPRLVDDQHQGIVPLEAAEGSPLYLLSEGYRLIRQLFVQTDQDSIEIKSLPFQAARLTQLKTSFGHLDVEWTKGQVRRMVMRVERNREIALYFPKEIRRFRQRLSKSEKGTMVTAPALLELAAGQCYLLDRFER